MKTLKSILIFTVLIAAFVYAMSFSGCSNSITSSGIAPKTYQARTEADFVKDHNLKAEPGAVIVVNLEDLHGKLDPEEFDTDLIGVDIIPYRYTETAEHTISIGDSSYFVITLLNENTKQIIYELTPQNNHATVTIPAGDYHLVITSLEEFGTDSAGGQVVFIQPDIEEALNRGGGQGEVDYDPGSLKSLLRTGRCSRCNLTGANLRGVDLRWANLQKADLRGANLRGANLKWAGLHRTDLREADLRGADLFKVSLFLARLTRARLDSADLSGADLRGADLCGTNKTGIIAHSVITNYATECWP